MTVSSNTQGITYFDSRRRDSFLGGGGGSYIYIWEEKHFATLFFVPVKSSHFGLFDFAQDMKYVQS